MNKQRRKRVEDLKTKLEELQAEIRSLQEEEDKA